MNLCKKSGLTPAKNAGDGMKARYLDQAVFETLHKLREGDKELSFDTDYAPAHYRRFAGVSASWESV